jgi:hypothetical protein
VPAAQYLACIPDQALEASVQPCADMGGLHTAPGIVLYAPDDLLGQLLSHLTLNVDAATASQAFAMPFATCILAYVLAKQGSVILRLFGG